MRQRGASLGSLGRTDEPCRLVIAGKPNPKQKLFFASRAKFTAYGGARGGGKSWALRRKLIMLCLNYPGIRCLLIRRTLSELRANHLLPMLKEYSGLLSYSESERCISLENGSVIQLGYLASDRDTLRYQGQEFDVIGIDEATQLSEHQFRIFCACLRGVNGFPKRMYLTCNPGGVGHAWVKRLFIDRDFRENERPEDYCFIPALVYDNEVLMHSDPEYLDSLKGLSPALRRAWLEGRWDCFEGQFFPEFSEELHVIGADSLQNNATRFIAFDYGLDMLALLVIAVGADGALTVERELTAQGLTLGEAADAIVEFISGLRIEYAVASPDLWNRRQDSGLSGFEIMQARRGMPPMIAADNRRVPGWRVLREYLKPEGGKVRLRICRECSVLIRSMQGLLCSRTRPEDASGEPHSLTHAPEALRYAVMSRARAAEASEELPFKFSTSRRGGIIL